MHVLCSGGVRFFTRISVLRKVEEGLKMALTLTGLKTRLMASETPLKYGSTTEVGADRLSSVCVIGRGLDSPSMKEAG